MPPLSARSSRRTVFEELRRRVVTLELAPGTPLSENELAAELGTSRTPVRESLILLAQEDLVQIFPKVGSFVSRVDPERVADAQFLREAVELASLDDMPAAPDPAQVEALRENLANQQLADNDPETFFRLDEDFHLGLLRLAGHERIWPTVVAAKGHLDRARRLGLTENPSMKVFRDQHADVLEALLRGEPDQARSMMRAHLRTVFADIERVRRRSPELFSSNSGAVPIRRSVAVWE
ncbi:GntR family transcriptional regulator [Pseudarthrobacter sp. NS4]|uniref:GntR family transcriptional regulator n=1 Tax=Pseudarthrobacter sp. NS4 TaxID=2973976 RepID=UPI002162FAA2|nr:GntR family transcriptional regulator [Pseudarthrobacter sp. NS4]